MWLQRADGSHWGGDASLGKVVSFFSCIGRPLADANGCRGIAVLGSGTFGRCVGRDTASLGTETASVPSCEREVIERR